MGWVQGNSVEKGLFGGWVEEGRRIGGRRQWGGVQEEARLIADNLKGKGVRPCEGGAFTAIILIEPINILISF